MPSPDIMLSPDIIASPDMALEAIASCASTGATGVASSNTAAKVEMRFIGPSFCESGGMPFAGGS